MTISLLSSMKYIFTLLSSIILSSRFSTSQYTPKLCIHCKFYTKKMFTRSEFGKCSLFVKENDDTNNYLVNGIPNKNTIDYYYCSVSRKYEHMCGKEGKYYERKN